MRGSRRSGTGSGFTIWKYNFNSSHSSEELIIFKRNTQRGSLNLCMQRLTRRTYIGYQQRRMGLTIWQLGDGVSKDIVLIWLENCVICKVYYSWVFTYSAKKKLLHKKSVCYRREIANTGYSRLIFKYKEFNFHFAYVWRVCELVTDLFGPIHIYFYFFTVLQIHGVLPKYLSPKISEFLLELNGFIWILLLSW